MQLPEQLEALRTRKVWVCYPMIYNATKHNGVGGYDKPPINPYTLFNASTDKAESLATYDEAVAQIGKTARVRVKGYDDIVETPVVGVGIAFGGTGLCGIDLDNVTERNAENDGYNMTEEAYEIVFALKSYTEISPSGNGIHILYSGSLPKDVAKKVAKPKLDIWGTMKAEYQLFDSGYMTLSGDRVGGKLRDDVNEIVAWIYEDYFKDVEPINELSKKKPPSPALSSPVVSSGSGITRERWLYEARQLSDYDLMKRIYASGSTGEKVKALYEKGDLSANHDNHSEADLALCAYLYGFLGDRDRTERLFRSSALYRATGKSRNYIERTLNRAEKKSVPLIGHIEFTDAEKRAYAQKKEAEELARINAGATRRFNSKTKEGIKRNDRRKI